MAVALLATYPVMAECRSYGSMPDRDEAADRSYGSMPDRAEDEAAIGCTALSRIRIVYGGICGQALNDDKKASSGDGYPCARANPIIPLFLACSGLLRASSPIKVIVNGATTDLGKAAIAAVTKARGMELAGAIDDNCVGQDAGEIASLGTPLELPITNNLIMVLGSLSQSTTAGVMVDFSEPSRIYENVRQATAFGLRSVVSTPGLDMGVVSKLITFCEKASMGCIIAPTLSIGLILLQEAAAAAAFHYNYVEIIESQQGLLEYPSSDAQRVAKSLCGLGRIYNEADYSKDYPARGEVVEDGVRIHSMKLPGLLRSMDVHLSAPGEVLSFKHDVTDVRANMPGMLLAIRRVIRLKNLVYGLEKIL